MVMGELDTSTMAWKPPWVLYTSSARFPPDELSIVLVRNLMQVRPQVATAVADLDPQLDQVLLADGADEDPQFEHVMSVCPEILVPDCQCLQSLSERA